LRLRLRAPDGPDELPPGRGRHHVHDHQPDLVLPQLQPGQGRGQARRRRHRPGARLRGGQAARAHPAAARLTIAFCYPVVLRWIPPFVFVCPSHAPAPSLKIVILMSKHVTAPALAVDVRELLQRPAAHRHVVVRAPLDSLATPVASVPPDRPVTVDVEIESVVEGLLVTGTVSATAVVRCVRCLRQFDQEVEAEVRELFALEPGEDEDEGYAVLPDDRLPLDTMARDALVLAFPALPLHSPDCAGLCPVCGADRNTVDCGHTGAEDMDPRWAALAGLQDSLEEDNDASPQA